MRGAHLPHRQRRCPQLLGTAAAAVSDGLYACDLLVDGLRGVLERLEARLDLSQVQLSLELVLVVVNPRGVE